jgi:hypothetical protein
LHIPPLQDEDPAPSGTVIAAPTAAQHRDIVVHKGGHRLTPKQVNSGRFAVPVAALSSHGLPEFVTGDKHPAKWVGNGCDCGYEAARQITDGLFSLTGLDTFSAEARDLIVNLLVRSYLFYHCMRLLIKSSNFSKCFQKLSFLSHF